MSERLARWREKYGDQTEAASGERGIFGNNCIFGNKGITATVPLPPSKMPNDEAKNGGLGGLCQYSLIAKNAVIAKNGFAEIAENPAPHSPADAFRPRFEERAAIAEHDGGLTRDQAEAIAREECRSYEMPAETAL